MSQQNEDAKTTPAWSRLNHESHMRRAIELSHKGGIVERAGGCFGAVIVDIESETIVGEGYNHVVANNDPTWHGEMQAIREAGQKLGRPWLHGCVLYTSAAPCPMCYTASMWARLEHVFYAATYADVKEYGSFDDADFLEELKKPNEERVLQSEELMREEACEVWKQFAKMPDRVHY